MSTNAFEGTVSSCFQSPERHIVCKGERVAEGLWRKGSLGGTPSKMDNCRIPTRDSMRTLEEDDTRLAEHRSSQGEQQHTQIINYKSAK